MDTENELKFLLPVDFNNSALTDWTKSVIMQGYLNDALSTIYRDHHGQPVFCVSVTTVNGDNITFKTRNVSEYQFEKLSANAVSENGGVYRLPNATRIRNKSGKYSITYKQPVDGELIEVEDNEHVTEGIFDAFQPYAADFVFKDRYEKEIGDEEWVVDYLRDYKSKAAYYTQAEVEMPQGRKKPLYMPPFIAEAYLYAVPQNDTRFTNQRLSDQDHAKLLYGEYTPK